MKNNNELSEVEKYVLQGGSDNYRIMQTSDKCFIIQKLFKKTITKGYFWNRKKQNIEEWHRIDKYGDKLFKCLVFHTNSMWLVNYETKEEANKWISDYKKYPIYHYF